MYSNSVASLCSDPAFRQQQEGPCALPSIPEDLVQPLRDALPKIDEALLSSVPVEALPLCQQLFSAWISTNSRGDDIPLPPSRAQTTMDIASLCRRSQQQELRQQLTVNTKRVAAPKQCRKSQSASLLSSWFSWSLPKRKSGSVGPMMVLGQKKSAYQNISDASSSTTAINGVARMDLSQRRLADSYILQKQLPQTPPPLSQKLPLRRPPQLPQRAKSHEAQKLSHQPIRQFTGLSSPPRPAFHHQNHTQQSHHSLGLSPSLSSSSSTAASGSTSSATFLSQANDGGTGNYRRSFSFMLSKFGTKVRQVIHSSSQRIHPQHKSANTTSNMPLASLSQFNLPELHNLPPPSSSPRKCSLQRPHMSNGAPSRSSSCQFKTRYSAGTITCNNQSIEDDIPSNGNGSVQQIMGDVNECIHPSLLLGQQSHHHSPSISSWKEVTYDLPQSSPAAASNQQKRLVDTYLTSQKHLLSNSGDYSDYSEYDSAHDDDVDDDTDGHHTLAASGTHDHDGTSNLKTPWSPPESLARRTLRSSKTDTNMKHKVSVPFIKMGLGKKNLDIDGQSQDTMRSISSSSFTLQWQEKPQDQRELRERIASTLKSVSLALYDIVRHNHAYQQFTSDTVYVAHPDLTPGEDTRELFASVPMTHWRDIFDQMAYIYENGILTTEHAIITMIYIERMLENSKQHLCEANWRLILLAGLITSIKVWDDCAVHNVDFLRIFPELDIKHINLIERRFLEHIDWDVSVRCSLFASTYFELQERR